MNRILASALLATGACVTLAAQPATAQSRQAPDSRWLPWLGCWQPTAGTAAASNMMVCVRPATHDAGVEVATVVDGETVSQRTLIADDQAHELNENGCSGWQRAAFAADGQRAYLRSDLTCEGGVRRSASAIMAMGSPAQWLDVQAVGMGAERVPRVVRYEVAPASSWPADYALSPARSVAVAEARVFAAAPLTLPDVEEASAQVDRDALVAFLIERNQPFDLDAANLESLSRAGVPDQVIDVVVAVSFPNKFHIDRQALRMALKPEQAPPKTYADRQGYYDPFGWGYYGGCYYGSWYCDPFAYGMYGFGLGLYSPYGYYGGYGYSPYWFGYGNQPIIIVGGSGQPSPGGQLINGQGYTRGGQPAGSSGGRTAHPRGSANPSSAGAGQARSSGGTRPPSQPSASPGGYTRGGSSGGSRGSARPRCCGQ